MSEEKKKKPWPLFAKIIHYEDKNDGQWKYSFILGPATKYNKETKTYELYGEDIFPIQVNPETSRFFTKHMKPHFDNLVKQEKLTKEEADRMSKTQKFEIYLIPDEDDSGTKKVATATPKTKKDEVDF